MEATTRALVLPVFRRYWLWHAWQEGGAAVGSAASAAAAAPARHWREGINLEEKAMLLGQQASRWVSCGCAGVWLSFTPAGSQQDCLCSTAALPVVPPAPRAALSRSFHAF